MVANFQQEAEKVIELLPSEFNSHQFLTLYAMAYPLSYLEWMNEYGNVKIAHNRISNALRNLPEKNLLQIKNNGKTMDTNIFGNEDGIVSWTKL